MVIEIKNLKKYYGTNMGVEDISFNVDKGEIFGFIGPNGSGKSTTIRVLMGLIFKTSGSVKILNNEVGENSYLINDKIGYVPSEINFYEKMTIGEFLQYSQELKKYEGKEYMKYVRDLDLDLNKKIEELSLGNKKKLAIISALINNPQLIILDEPTSGLDPLIQKKFYNILRSKAKEGITILLSSHNLDEVRNLCSKVAIIKNGKIVKIETLADSDNKEKRIKKIKIYSKDKIILNLDGITNFEEDKELTQFNFFGDFNDLIIQLSKFKIDDLKIDDNPNQEQFINYYEKGDANE